MVGFRSVRFFCLGRSRAGGWEVLVLRLIPRSMRQQSSIHCAATSEGSPARAVSAWPPLWFPDIAGREARDRSHSGLTFSSRKGCCRTMCVSRQHTGRMGQYDRPAMPGAVEFRTQRSIRMVGSVLDHIHGDLVDRNIDKLGRVARIGKASSGSASPPE